MDISYYSNLSSFLSSNFSLFDSQEIEKTWSSELEVRYSSRESLEKLLTGNFDISIRIPSSILKSLGSKQKLLVYLILRALRIKYDNEYFRYILDDFINLLDGRSFTNNFKYFYLKNISDDSFCCYFDKYIQENQRTIHRQLYQKVTYQNKKLALIDLIVYKIRPEFKIKNKIPPKRLQRHKGYRDHGSLGSDFTKALKDQIDDWSLKEKEVSEEQESILKFYDNLIKYDLD